MTVFLTSGRAFALTRYQVHVLSEKAADLAQVQTQVPDAYWVQGDEQIFILAGTFINRNHAQRRQTELERLGLQVRVVSRTEMDPPFPPAVAPPSNPISSSPSASRPSATVPAATAPNLQPASQRPFATQVPNPTQDPHLEEQVRRFFPRATVVEHQGQTALRTGEFSRLSLAQDQARWLTARGLPAVAVALAESKTESFPAVDPRLANLEQGENYWVLVADPTGEKLPALESLLTGSLPLIYDNLRVVRTGGFANAQAAEEQVRYLASQGYEAGVFPADLRRSQPLLEQKKAPQPSSDPDPTTTAHPSPDSLASSEAPSFWVVVQGGEEVLSRLQQYAPDAFVRGSVIQVGTYRQRSNAEQVQQSLSEAGFNARIVAVEN
ncbi:MAG: SPOR domain-containing protein [Cyanobacteriota bacterium]